MKITTQLDLSILFIRFSIVSSGEHANLFLQQSHLFLFNKKMPFIRSIIPIQYVHHKCVFCLCSHRQKWTTVRKCPLPCIDQGCFLLSQMWFWFLFHFTLCSSQHVQSFSFISLLVTVTYLSGLCAFSFSCNCLHYFWFTHEIVLSGHLLYSQSSCSGTL